MNEPVRPETLALDALIEAAVTQVATAAPREPADRMLFLGNRVWCKYSNERYDIVMKQYYG